MTARSSQYLAKKIASESHSQRLTAVTIWDIHNTTFEKSFLGLIRTPHTALSFPPELAYKYNIELEQLSYFYIYGCLHPFVFMEDALNDREFRRELIKVCSPSLSYCLHLRVRFVLAHCRHQFFSISHGAPILQVMTICKLPSQRTVVAP